MRAVLSFATMLAVAGSSMAAARTLPNGGTPQSVERLLACRQTTDPAARLACFDAESGRVAASLASKDLVVIDKERARSAGRSLFGFSVPNFGGLLGSGGDIKSIDGVVAAVSRNADGGWLLRLADGSRWSQTDDSMLGLPPRAGDKVVVKRGVLGSFSLSVAGQPGMKVARVG